MRIEFARKDAPKQKGNEYACRNGKDSNAQNGKTTLSFAGERSFGIGKNTCDP
ncbi:hypothetical protein D3C71_1983380 [compost metagenome]